MGDLLFLIFCIKNVIKKTNVINYTNKISYELNRSTVKQTLTQLFSDSYSQCSIYNIVNTIVYDNIFL